jgi:hypothetical protein
MATYNAIQTQTLSSPTSIVTFSSFAGYTDLVLTINGALTGSAVKYIYFNGTNSNMSCVTYTATTTSTGNGYYSTGYLDVNNSSTNEFTDIVQIFSYGNSLKKGYLCNHGAATTVEIIAGNWGSTSPITSLSVATTSNNFATGTTFSLYGILAA